MMYCPNCKQEYDGKFCPECGTKLIEKPATSGVSLNLGDANAISGGLHVSDSHAIHNEDKSVHNITNTTSTVNNITQVSAQKTEIELLQEHKTQFLNACKRAYEDNVLEQSEVVALEELRIKIGLDKSTADNILESVRVMSDRNARKSELNPIAKTKLKILTNNLQKNEVKALIDQIDSLEPLVRRFYNDELSRKYYLVLAALKPEKCIEQKERTKTDTYWEAFWCYLAYIKAGRLIDAEETLASLDHFSNYPEDNMTVLAAAGELMKGYPEEAKEYLDATTGEYTPALQRFVDSIYLLLEPNVAKEMGADENTCAFYLVNFFGQKDPKAKADEERLKREAAEAERKRKEMEEQKRKEEEARKKAEEEVRSKAKAKENKPQEQQDDNFQTFSVILAKVGTAKLQVVKAVWEACGLSGMKDAKDLVDGAPSTLIEGLSKDEAENLKKTIEEAGATINLITETKRKDSDVAPKSVSKQYGVQPQTIKELRSIISSRLRKDKNADLNDIDISKVKDLRGLFKGLKVGKIDISKWDVSKVEMMYQMFYNCENFDCDLSNWDVSKVISMREMFHGCKQFEGKGLGNWDVSQILECNKSIMFYGCDSLKIIPRWYFRSIIGSNDYEQTKWLPQIRNAAEQGDAYAQFLIGLNIYKYTTKDYNEAIKWFLKAGEHGDASAQLVLGRCYYEGQGTAKDYNAALRWWCKAAEQGIPYAMVEIANLYIKGYGVKEDKKEAMRWWSKAVEIEPKIVDGLRVKDKESMRDLEDAIRDLYLLIGRCYNL